MIYFADTNVLYGQLGRDLLPTFRRRGLVQAYWSEYVLDELTRARARDPGVSAGQLAYLIRTIREALPEAIVPAAAVEGVTVDPHLFPDRADVDIVAAAVACGASAIITANVRDFPPRALEPYALQTVSLDDALASALTAQPGEARTTLGRFLRMRTRPAYTPESLARRLTTVGLPDTAAAVSSVLA